VKRHATEQTPASAWLEAHARHLHAVCMSRTLTDIKGQMDRLLNQTAPRHR
jgi:hypothetical protein